MYQLVLRTIEFLTEQRQQKQAGASKGPKNGDSDDIGGGVRLAFAHVKCQQYRSLGDGVEEAVSVRAAGYWCCWSYSRCLRRPSPT